MLSEQERYNQWHKEHYQLDISGSSAAEKKFYDVMTNRLGLSSSDAGKKLLDIACGKGLFLRHVKEKNWGIELYGLDIADYAVEQAKKLVPGDFVVGRAEEMPYADNYFDYLTCLGGLEYYLNPDKGTKEMFRVLKHGGKVLIYVPNLMFIGHIYMAWRHGSMPTEAGNAQGKIYYDYNQEKFYTFLGWKDILENNGLKLIGKDKYNKVGSTKRVSKATRIFYNNLFRYFIPFNLSYSFIFVCKRI